jgi:predicted GIY-YIG superfamily endonuclease
MKIPRLDSPSGVYIIICRANLKAYIGSSYQIHERWLEHYRELKKNQHNNDHLQRAWNKYGEDQFMVGVLEYTSKNNLFEREQVYLDRFKPFGDAGFNILPRAGGREGGFTHTPEVRAQISAKTRGKKKSPEAIKNMIAWRTLEPERYELTLESNRIPVRLMSPDGEIVEIKGLRVFARKYGLDHQAVGKVLRGKLRKCKGWHLPEMALHTDILIDPTGGSHTIVENNLKSFCRTHGINYSSIHDIIRGRRAAYRGWTCPSPR